MTADSMFSDAVSLYPLAYLVDNEKDDCAKAESHNGKEGGWHDVHDIPIVWSLALPPSGRGFLAGPCVFAMSRPDWIVSYVSRTRSSRYASRMTDSPALVALRRT